MPKMNIILNVWQVIAKNGKLTVDELKKLIKISENDLNKAIEFLYDLGLINYKKEGKKIVLSITHETDLLQGIPCFSCPNLSYCSVHDVQKTPIKCTKFVSWLSRILRDLHASVPE